MIRRNCLNKCMLYCQQGCCGTCCRGVTCLNLTQNELDLLRQLAQTPFLPVGYQPDLEVPVYLEADKADAAAYGMAIIGLLQKCLISLDYNCPLLNYKYEGYESCTRKGSFALTAAGQQAIETLAIQGIGE